VEVFDRARTQPLATHQFSYGLSALERYELAGLEPDFRDPERRLERLRGFGHELYNLLFSDEIRALWERYREAQNFLELCLRLGANARSLGALP
jgi:hypothetical protein